MGAPHPMVEVWRGDFLECVHSGHAVICDASGDIVEAWGSPEEVILPRSSVKILQALPLIDSGAAEAAGLGSEHFALACASHQGAPIHSDRVRDWLGVLGLGEPDLRCGPQEPPDRDTREAMIRTGEAPCQLHNNCSGKHAGFLTLSQRLGGGADYVDPDHPVQRAVRGAFEEMTEETSPGFAIDGCSAPNFAATLHGLARAMARLARAREDGDGRDRAAVRLREAMIAHPELVAGEGRACTELMRAMEGVAIKTGAEGVFTAILPEQGLGIALKITDGATRASNCAIAALLVRLGVLDRDHPATRRYLDARVLNRRGIDTGVIRADARLLAM